MDTSVIGSCIRCRVAYDWRRSGSNSLKMTYCGVLCEKSDLGFTIEALLRDWSPTPRSLPATPPAESPRAALAPSPG